MTGLIAIARCHRDALASLGAPARKNRLSALGLHPRAKTVRLGPVAPIRLECALGHGNSLVLLTRISAAKQTLSINDAGVKGQTHPVTMTRPSWYTCSLTLGQAIFLFFAGMLGGALNSVAGGGGFIAFPAMLITGVPPVAANVTQTVALWFGTTASSGAYWHRLNVPRRIMIPLILASIAGGLAGAFLLLHTPAHTFLHLIPWLMLAATLLFALGPWIVPRKSSLAHDASASAIAGASIFELLVSVYGGYFGGGLGIMNLAMLSAIGMTDIHAMNALKTVLSAVINGVGVVTFIAVRVVYWTKCLAMIAGALVGGYFGAHYAQKLPQKFVRGFVILVGTAMTIYFFIRAA
jgi:uncharacterized membrane protein YfcA